MSCDFCGTLLPERVLVCPCGRLAYGKRLAARARDAAALEATGELAAARDAWQETLAFLPGDATQASEIRARIAKLDGAKAPLAASSGRGRAAGLVGTLGAFVLGLKAKLGFVLTVAKSSKVLLTFSTMLLSLWFYARDMGLPFAALFVALIWVHEMGHVIAGRAFGIPVSAPIFVPFLGAFVRLGKRAPSVVADAWTGLGGPLLGSLGAFVALGAGRAFGSDLLLAAADAGIVINLLNLVPIYPFDGGRVVPVLPLPFRRTPDGDDFHRATPAQRLGASLGYLGLIAVLVVAYMHLEPELAAMRKRHGDIASIASASE